MPKDSLQLKILKLLRKSTISDHDKEMVRILLPVMKLPALQKIRKTLKEEREEMAKLDQKQKRIEMKYKIMVDKLCDMELKKK
jgi:hypothetical protein